MELHIGCIPGDGIGPEIVREAKKVLDRVAEKFGHTIQYTEILLGGASIDVHGIPLTQEAIDAAKKSDAVLMGSIGGDANTSPWYKLPPQKRPEAGLLAIRKELGFLPICGLRYYTMNWQARALLRKRSAKPDLT